MTPRPFVSDAAPPVSIVGIGARLPGATSTEDFWQLLLAGRDATGTPPTGRIGTRHGGYLDDIESFDNDWFAISDRETAAMDPQQRLAMEVAVEALDDAGIGYRTRGSAAAVVFGACGYDHGITMLGQPGHDAPYAVTGSALSIIANRLSYVLDLHGPSLVVDSACSSSLAAVEFALRLLADESVPFAIVGGVNLTLLPHTADYLSDGGFLAPDGRSKPFDAAADGYTRGDGCGVVILQRTADAVRCDSRVYAEIAGTAVGSDGRSNGLYAPNGRAQQDTLRTAWSRAGLDPNTAGYFECHGTGTSLGDAVEVGALASVAADERVDPIWIGSVKSNIGHLEAAAGVTGLIKTALSIHHGVIAPTINFHTENPLLKLEERGLRVPTEPVDWSAVPIEERRAGVSSFGFGGTNAHVVLRGIAPPRDTRGNEYPVLITVTGRDDTQLRAQALRFAERLDRAESVIPDARAIAAISTTRQVVSTRESAGLAGKPRHPSQMTQRRHREGAEQPLAAGNDSVPVRALNDGTLLGEFSSAAARLIPESHRAAILAHDRTDAVDRLRALAQGDSNTALVGPTNVRRRGGILFLFSGQGGQHPRMGRALAARHPLFADALAEAADAIADADGPRVWTPRHGFAHALSSNATENRTDSTELIQPSIFAFQVAMAKLLASWGIRPDAIAGHSLGEIAGAAVSGTLALPDAARIVVQRSRSLALLDGLGAMALLEATPDEATKLVEPMRTEVGIAAINGPRSVVVSGVPRYIDTLVRRAKRRNIFATRIAVDFAAHSPQVAAVLPRFVDALGDLAPRLPLVPIYSTARRGALITDAAMDADYWAENAAGTVHLAAALERAATDGLTTVLEIAPHPVLIPSVREYPDFRDASHAATVRDDEVGGFLTCLARIYAEGREVDWSAQGPFSTPPRRHWRKRRFPLLTATSSTSPTSFASTPTVDSGFPTDDLHDHVVQGTAIVPAVFWLRRLLHLAHTWSGGTMLADLVVHERADLTSLPEVSYHGHDGSLRAELSRAGTETLASARAGREPSPADIVAWMRVVDANRAVRHRMRVIPTGTFYDELRGRLLEYGPRFRVLRGIAAGTDRALGLFDSAELHSTATLDGCLHLLAAASYDELPVAAVPLPIGIESAWLSTEPNRVVLEAHAVVRERTGTGLRGDVIGTDQHGVPCLALSGVRIRFAQLSASEGSAVTHEGADAMFGLAAFDRGAFDREALDQKAFHHETWETSELTTLGVGVRRSVAQRALVVGESDLAIALARTLDVTLPTERVAREPDAASPIVAAVMAGRPGTGHTAVVLVWPEESSARESGRDQSESGPFDHGDGVAASVSRVLELIQRVQSDDGTASLTVVLPDRLGVGTEPKTAVPLALAGLVRSLQLESGRAVRLVWSDADASNLPTLSRLVTTGFGGASGRRTGPPDELRLSGGAVAVRRFRPTRLRSIPTATIDAAGTYVVTGGLGALGAVAVRWLLDAGARDVVVLTRAPRPVPPLLDGLEHRIVVVRCDSADRGDLSNALNDIRECGSSIRGIVHAAGTLEDAPFDAVTNGQLSRMFAPKLTAATNLVELSATDPTDFILLFSSATGAIGAPGQAAYAAANAAMDSLARTQPRRVLSIGWGTWETGLAEAAGGAAHIRRAGIAAFDIHRGTALLSQLLHFDGAYVLALDHTPTADTSPLAAHLTNLLAPNQHAVADPFGAAPAVPPPAPQHETGESLTATIRRVLARTLDLPAERIGLTADFNDLGLSSLLAIELRRNLESRLRIRISTAELFQHSTITALGSALVDRVAATTFTNEAP